MAYPFIGEIMVFAGNFAPRGYLQCAGQTLQISQYDGLFAVIGTIYGGDGIETFKLPDFRSRIPLGEGMGPGLSNYYLGETGGFESVTLVTSEMPQHTHPLPAVPSVANGNIPAPGQSLANQTGNSVSFVNVYAPYDPANQISLLPVAISDSFGGNAHANVQPVLAIMYCISTDGVFPRPPQPTSDDAVEERKG